MISRIVIATLKDGRKVVFTDKKGLETVEEVEKHIADERGDEHFAGLVQRFEWVPVTGYPYFV